MIDERSSYLELFPTSQALDDLIREVESTSYGRGGVDTSSRRQGHEQLEQRRAQQQQQEAPAPGVGNVGSPSFSSASAALEALLGQQNNTVNEDSEQQGSKNGGTSEDTETTTSTSSSSAVNTRKPAHDFSDMFRSVLAAENPLFDFPEIGWSNNDDETKDCSSPSSARNARDAYEEEIKNEIGVSDVCRMPPPASTAPTQTITAEDKQRWRKRGFDLVDCTSSSGSSSFSSSSSKPSATMLRRSKTLRTELCGMRREAIQIAATQLIRKSSTACGSQNSLSDFFPKCYSDGHLLGRSMNGADIDDDAAIFVMNDFDKQQVMVDNSLMNPQLGNDYGSCW